MKRSPAGLESRLKNVPAVRKNKQDCESHLKSCQAKKEQAAAERMPTIGRPKVETARNKVDATGSSLVFASICSPTSSLQKKNCREQILQYFFTPEMSNYEVEQMRVYLVEIFDDAGLSFRLVERQSFRRFVEKICHGASNHLPGCTILSGPLLEKRGEIFM